MDVSSVHTQARFRRYRQWLALTFLLCSSTLVIVVALSYLVAMERMQVAELNQRATALASALNQVNAQATTLSRRLEDINESVRIAAEPVLTTIQLAGVVAEANKSNDVMDVVSQYVITKLRIARDRRDVVQVLCLNDKLNGIETAMRQAHKHRTNIDSAANRADIESATRELGSLIKLRTEVERLRAEAAQCVDEQ